MSKRRSMKECEEIAKPAMRSALTGVSIPEVVRQQLARFTLIESDAYVFQLHVPWEPAQEGLVIAEVKVLRNTGEATATVFRENIELAEKRGLLPPNPNPTIT